MKGKNRMNATHTKGPWFICGLSASMITDKNAAIVAEIPNLEAQSEIVDQQIRNANARLIAKAPEMYSYIESIARCVKCSEAESQVVPPETVDARIDWARQFIARLKGEA